MKEDVCKLHERNLTLKLQGVNSHIKALMEMHEHSERYSREKLEEIHSEVKKTNGRVTSLEGETRFWRWLTNKPYRLLVSILILYLVAELLVKEEVLKYVLILLK